MFCRRLVYLTRPTFGTAQLDGRQGFLTNRCNGRVATFRTGTRDVIPYPRPHTGFRGYRYDSTVVSSRSAFYLRSTLNPPPEHHPAPKPRGTVEFTHFTGQLL